MLRASSICSARQRESLFQALIRFVVLFTLLPLAPGSALALMVGFHEVQTSGVSAASVTINVPAGTKAGDLLLAAVAARNAATVTAPAGWTAVAALNTTSGTTLRQVVYYRVATGTEPASYTFTLSSSVRTAGLIVAYRGVDTANPIDVSAGQANASASTITAPSITPSVTGTMLVGLFSAATGTTISSAAGMAYRADVLSGGGTGIAIGVFDQQQATASATGTRTATAGGSAVNIGQLVALRPASSLPSPVVWYKMDETSWNGTTGEVLDSGTAGLNGTGLGGATTATGVKCRAGSFPGSTGRVDVAHNNALNMQSTFTVTGWIRPSAWPSSGNLMSFFSKDDNYEFHITSNGGLNWWWNAGATALTAPASTAPAAQWTFVAFVFTRGSQLVYAGGTSTSATLRVSGTDSTQLNTNIVKLQIGDDQDFNAGARRWNGSIDDIRLYDRALTASEVDAIRLASSPCGVDHYRVQNNATGINCQAENITVTAHDASHNAVTVNSATTISLTAQYASGAGGPGNRGDWSLVSGSGTLNNGTADDGAATYTFAAGGESSVVFALKDTWAQTVNIVVSDGTASDTSGTASADASYNQNLAFSAAGFRFVDGSNATLPNQVSAVTSGTLNLQAIQSSSCGATGACTGVCTAAPGFANGSSVAIELASECVNPTACQAGMQVSITNSGTSTIAANNNGAVTSYTTKNLLFGANGAAAFTLTYPDVGAIRLYARYAIPLGTGAASSNTMTGSSNSFVIKPYSFAISSIARTSDSFANPGASSSGGPAFIAAGDPFRATVTAVNANGNATPNYGKETSPEGARVSATLAGGLGLTTNPGLANATSFGAFSGGAATGTTFSWSEVGIITLSAGVGDGDYLGAGDVAVTAPSGNVGRFIPHHFDLSAPSFTPRSAAACSPASTFTYMSEPFGLAFTLTARAAAGSATQNYSTANGFAKLPSTAGTSSPSSTMGFVAKSGTTNLTTRLDTSNVNAISWSAGVAGVNATLALSRGAALDGPYAAVNIGIAPQDQDGVTLASSAFNMAIGASNDHALVGTGDFRFGRLRLYNATGSGLQALPIAMEFQYFNGLGFVPNPADSCTTLAKSDFIFRSFQKNLSACETWLATPSSTVTAASGKATLTLAQPVAGGDGKVDGSVDLMPRLSSITTGSACINASSTTVTNANKPWLQFDWGGTGSFDQNPSARATFGLYRKSSDFIYFREMY
ncbi:MAG TPA: LamG domain-containing protein [Burkholderiales bacterium]|nr:LamG domain-containing protein [Burkholderiales bacterium]